MHAHLKPHIEVVYKIVKYLKETSMKGVLFQKGGELKLEAYTNANCVSSMIDKRSNTKYCTFLKRNLVTWRSKKQPMVAHSSAEADLRVMAQGTCELLWLKIILSNLQVRVKSLMMLYCDNKTTIIIAHNPIQQIWTKQWEIDRCFIKEKLDSRQVCTLYVSSSNQLAYVLTKGLSNANFQQIINKPGMRNIFVLA